MVAIDYNVEMRSLINMKNLQNKLISAARSPRKAMAHLIRSRNSPALNNQSFEDFFQAQQALGFPVEHARFRREHGYPLSLDNPASFSQKLVHRRLFSRNEIWKEVTDKVAVRNYLCEQDQANVVELIPVHQIMCENDELEVSKISGPIIIKAAWAAGLNVILKNPATDYDANIKSKLAAWAKSNYKVSSLIWASSQIPRRFIVEELLLDAYGNIPRDYKFFVFDGRVEMVQVHAERFTNHTSALFSKSGTRLSQNYTGYGRAELNLDVPAADYERMIAVAESLATGFDFVRIDLYYLDRRIFFGEITQTPYRGLRKFTQKDFDFDLGSKWDYKPERKSLPTAGQ